MPLIARLTNLMVDDDVSAYTSYISIALPWMRCHKVYKWSYIKLYQWWTGPTAHGMVMILWLRRDLYFVNKTFKFTYSCIINLIEPSTINPVVSLNFLVNVLLVKILYNIRFFFKELLKTKFFQTRLFVVWNVLVRKYWLHQCSHYRCFTHG